jgi:hypothetical protein
MRVNTKESIATANAVHERFGSWEAAKRSSDYKDGTFVLRNQRDSRSGQITTVTETVSKKKA